MKLANENLVLSRARLGDNLSLAQAAPIEMAASFQESQPRVVENQETQKTVVKNVGIKGAMTGARKKLSLRIVRKTANIALDLPVPVFMARNFLNAYSILNRYLPDGVTYSVKGGLLGASGNPDKVEITFTQGANIDVFEIDMITGSYTELLAELNSNSTLDLVSLRDHVANSIDSDQFTQRQVVTRSSVFGSSNEENIISAEHEDGTFEKNNFIDIPLADLKIDKSEGFICFIKQKAAFTNTKIFGIGGFSELKI